MSRDHGANHGAPPEKPPADPRTGDRAPRERDLSSRERPLAPRERQELAAPFRRPLLLLAAGTTVLALACTAPVAAHAHAGPWPDWLKIGLALSLLQACYGVWLTVAGDWAAVRVSMVVNAFVATVYGTAFMVAILTPPEQIALFDLETVRSAARWWCPAVLVLAAALSFYAGRLAQLWRAAQP
ncbi:MAG TPA: hypothetical protein VFE24_04600 [Pirellulales bacterium]|jgi:hypothetical protein|nr:hypothetical protein [Pirellulales bacterium]